MTNPHPVGLLYRSVPAMLTIVLLTLLGVPVQAATTMTYDTAHVSVRSETGMKRGRVMTRIADSPRKRYLGLRGVTRLDTDAGMVFLYSNTRRRTFTMRDVRIPLDIMFADEDGRIRSIHTARPGEEMIRSRHPARYVLETNAGWARRRGVRVGDRLRIYK